MKGDLVRQSRNTKRIGGTIDVQIKNMKEGHSPNKKWKQEVQSKKTRESWSANAKTTPNSMHQSVT